MHIETKGTEKFINISYKEFTITSMFVSNLSLIPYSIVFFDLKYLSLKKRRPEKEIVEKMTHYKGSVKMKKKKPREENVASFAQNFAQHFLCVPFSALSLDAAKNLKSYR